MRQYHTIHAMGPLLLMLLAACSEPSEETNTLKSSAVNCVRFEASYSANSQIASLRMTNACARDLDFSEARIQFQGARPTSQPWSENPPNFSWIAWQKDDNGFHYKKNPGESWVRVVLAPNASLKLQFNATGQPQYPQLYLGASAPAPLPAPDQEPKPVPVPTHEPVPSQPWPKPGHDRGQEIVGYYQSWSSPWAGSGDQHNLSRLPPYITTVLLAFVRPEASYRAGQNSWVGTGFDFSSDFAVVRASIAELKRKNPHTRVLLSIGGATYVNWDQSNPQGIAALVRDLGADGADLDYEPTAGSCSWGTGGQSCPGDADFIRIIKQFREALPRPYMLTTAAWSTGAFGPAPYAASRYSGNLIGSNFGLYVNPLREVGHMFDAIYIMSYDAGGPYAPAGQATGYDAKQAFEAYRKLYQGPLMLGVEVPPEAWGGHASTVEEAQDRAHFVKTKGGQGMMIWSLQKAGNPGASAYVQAMCRTLELPRCDLPLP